jgi:hypothetical protein
MGIFSKNKCVICSGNHYSIDKDNEVCDYHSSWIVTVCTSCHRTCYSDVVHICPRCLQLSSRNILGGGFSKNRRALLRKYGQE